MFVQEGNVREKGDKVRNWFCLFLFSCAFPEKEESKAFHRLPVLRGSRVFFVKFFSWNRSDHITLCYLYKVCEVLSVTISSEL